MRNKVTGQSEGYGFVEFASREAAERALSALNGAFSSSGSEAASVSADFCFRGGPVLMASTRGFAGTTMPSSTQTARLNWASFGIGARRPEGGNASEAVVNEFSLFVGDLAPEITDLQLLDTFRAQFPSVRPCGFCCGLTISCALLVAPPLRSPASLRTQYGPDVKGGRRLLSH